MAHLKFRPRFGLGLIMFAVFGCSGQFTVRKSSAAVDLTGVTQTLIALMEKQDKTKISADDYQSTSLQQLITFGTPAGYRLKLRYLDFGMALVEALRLARDPDIRKRLIEEVQWARDPKVRAEAIITLAGMLEPSHKKYFKEAILDSKVGIRFSAVEALQIWGRPEDTQLRKDALLLLKTAMVRDFSPLMQIYAAQALFSLGDGSGIELLWKGLDHDSWVIRAMSARCLGDFGKPEDYTKILASLNRETRNDFVLAELSIAALKLISKKGEKVYYSPASPGWKKNDEVAYTLGKDSVVELEPLVIVPPQLRIPPSLQAAAQINSKLLLLIRDRLGLQLDKIQAQDPVLQDLNAMVTPTGFALKTRYAELSYLVVEALAGTTDPIMRSELIKLAGESPNPLVRASALIALSYSRDETDLFLVERALSDKNAIVRMGAMEAIEIGRFQSLIPAVFTVAGTDSCAALQLYAMQVLAKFGNPAGRQAMLGRLNDPDWPARAMAFWYLGRYGTEDDYSMVLSRLPVEQNPFVQSEIVAAVLRLAPLE